MLAVCHHLLDQCVPRTAASPLAIGTVGADAAVFVVTGLIGGYGRGGYGLAMRRLWLQRSRPFDCFVVDASAVVRGVGCAAALL